MESASLNNRAVDEGILSRFVKKEFQTFMAIVSALGFVVGLHEVSQLAHLVLGSFDKIVHAVANAIKEVLHLPFDLKVIKFAILYSPIFVFIFTGINSYIKTKSLFVSNKDFALSMLCQSVILSLLVVKSVNAFSEAPVDQSGLFVIAIAIFICTTLFYAIVPLPIFLFLKKKKNYKDLTRLLRTLMWSTLITSCLFFIICATLLLQSASTSSSFLNILTSFAVTVIGLIIMTPIFIMPWLMLFNPKRLKQVTAFVVVFMLLAFSSKIFDGAFQYLQQDDSTQQVISGEVTSESSANEPQTN